MCTRPATTRPPPAPQPSVRQPRRPAAAAAGRAGSGRAPRGGRRHRGGARGGAGRGHGRVGRASATAPDARGDRRPGSTPSGWPTTWPACSRRRTEAGPAGALAGGRSPSSRPGRRCPSSGSAPRSRRWAGGWPCCDALTAGSAATACAAAAAGHRRAGAGAAAAARPLGRPPGRVGGRGRASSSTPRPRDELVGAGYRREHQVEHRGEVAVRGGIVDVFPSTADAPVRIDLWGDEVDRLTAFDVGDQRSSTDLDAVVFFGCRELVPHRRRAGRRPSALVRRRPWGAAEWERLADGELFDGMESWLPWLDAEEHVLPDLLRPAAQVVLVEPAADPRPGGRAARRGGGAGRDPGRHLGRPGRATRIRSRACTSPSTACCATAGAGVVAAAHRARGSRDAGAGRAALRPGGRRPARLAARRDRGWSTRATR